MSHGGTITTPLTPYLSLITSFIIVLIVASLLHKYDVNPSMWMILTLGVFGILQWILKRGGYIE